MVFMETSVHMPDKLLDQSKVQDFQANASYLEGEEILTEAWSAPGKHYSTAGIKIRYHLTTTTIYIRDFRLVRNPSKYTSIYYLPTSMFTLTSWVSFLLPPTCYPARTSLLVTVFLCQVPIRGWLSILLSQCCTSYWTSYQIGIFNGVIKDTPNQDGGLTDMKIYFTFFCLLQGLTALEIWCLACIICVFQALLAYVVILVW